uniref:hypothetical protein n=1 Tax=Candidatus Marithrix sp. Canyon 246 TaxID=1827136 RepID=UPI00114CCBAE
MAGETLSSQAIYDSKTKTLYLEDILVPFINELNFDSIKFKNMFDGEKVSGYILYNPKTRSVNIPCFKATTTSQFGDGFEGDIIYYQDVIMTSRHITSAMFGIEDLIETDSCESSVEPTEKPTLTTTPTTT